jgi:hypothetical protein
VSPKSSSVMRAFALPLPHGRGSVKRHEEAGQNL